MAYLEYYHAAWGVYLASAVCLYIVWFIWTKGIKNIDLRQYIRLVPAVLLFTPAFHNGENLAPAFIISLGELFTNGTKEAMQGVVPMLMVLMVGAILLAVSALLKRPSKKNVQQA